jgi:hypothetical protein
MDFWNWGNHAVQAGLLLIQPVGRSACERPAKGLPAKSGHMPTE